MRLCWVLGGVFAASVAGCSTEPPISVEKIFLRPTPDVARSPADLGYVYDAVDVPIAENRHVSIWHVKAESPRGIVVIIPGSDQNKSRYLIGLPVFVPSGFDVILMDYEGFGESSGGPLDLARLLDDGLAVVDYALARHANVVAFGVSTGTPVTAWVAARRELTAVMFEACLILDKEPQLYLEDVLNIEIDVLWEIAELYLTEVVPGGFDIERHVKRVDEPKLFLHSTEDDVTPFRGGKIVFDAAAEPKEFFEMRGGHGEMIELDFETYSARINEWLDRQIPAQSATSTTTP